MSTVQEASLTFAWPDPKASEIEMELYVARGRLLERPKSIPPLLLTDTPTRLRLESLERNPPEIVRLSYRFVGESPVPTVPRFLDPKLGRAIDNFEYLGSDPDNAVIKAIDEITEEDILAIQDCRTRYSEGGGFIADARRFFFNLDLRTNPIWKKDLLLQTTTEGLLRERLVRRFGYVRGTELKFPKIADSEITSITEVFKSSADKLSLDNQLKAYLWFSAGLLEHKCPHMAAAAGPDSGNLLLIMELAFAAMDGPEGAEHAYWWDRLPTLIYMVDIYARRFKQKLKVSQLCEVHLHRSYVIGPIEIERDRDAFIKECATDPGTKATEMLNQRFYAG